jgi:hypothetical protein
MMRDTSE